MRTILKIKIIITGLPDHSEEGHFIVDVVQLILQQMVVMATSADVIGESVHFPTQPLHISFRRLQPVKSASSCLRQNNNNNNNIEF